ncbi:hypothetical protein LZ31DRAFT_480390 [Colletotrichum somersetense]|nr:hypothetical protein LZ31DRAFT_480390 [Colletotrichum somersetense]
MEKLLRDSISDLISAVKDVKFHPKFIRDFLVELRSLDQVTHYTATHRIISQNEWTACITLFRELVHSLKSQSAADPLNFRKWDSVQYKGFNIGYCTSLLYGLTLSLHISASSSLLVPLMIVDPMNTKYIASRPIPNITKEYLSKFGNNLLAYATDDSAYMRDQIRHLTSLSTPTLVDEEDANTDTSMASVNEASRVPC